MPATVPLHAFVGSWSGTGHGSYPDLAPLDCVEETAIALETDWGMARVTQRTWLDDGGGTKGKSLHLEEGLIVPRADGSLEYGCAQDSGRIESMLGEPRLTPTGGVEISWVTTAHGNDGRLVRMGREWQVEGTASRTGRSCRPFARVTIASTSAPNSRESEHLVTHVDVLYFRAARRRLQVGSINGTSKEPSITDVPSCSGSRQRRGRRKRSDLLRQARRPAQGVREDELDNSSDPAGLWPEQVAPRATCRSRAGVPWNQPEGGSRRQSVAGGRTRSGPCYRPARITCGRRQGAGADAVTPRRALRRCAAPAAETPTSWPCPGTCWRSMKPRSLASSHTGSRGQDVRHVSSTSA